MDYETRIDTESFLPKPPTPTPPPMTPVAPDWVSRVYPVREDHMMIKERTQPLTLSLTLNPASLHHIYPITINSEWKAYCEARR